MGCKILGWVTSLPDLFLQNGGIVCCLLFSYSATVTSSVVILHLVLRNLHFAKRIALIFACVTAVP